MGDSISLLQAFRAAAIRGIECIGRPGSVIAESWRNAGAHTQRTTR